MDNMTENGFLDLAEAASYLRCIEEELLKLVAAKKVPHSITPLGKSLFDRERLRQWVLSFEQMPQYARQGGLAGTEGTISLAEEICRRFPYPTRDSRRYRNLCQGQIVFAQLHERRAGDGVDLALRGCGDDSALPSCTVLEKINVRELSGYSRVNQNWLDGTRWTRSPAAAFHVPKSFLDDPESPGWKEVERLLAYAAKKLENESETNRK